MRIALLDGGTLPFPESAWHDLGDNAEFRFFVQTPPEKSVNHAEGVEILLTNKVVLDRTTIEALPGLRFVAVLATGTNNVDLTAARERGIPVSNVPAYSAEAVAQHTFAMLLALTNRVEAHSDDVHAGGWIRSTHFVYELHPMTDLVGKTLAVIGFGDIGRRVAEIGHAFGMKVIGVSRSRRGAPDWQPFAWGTMEEAFAAADVVSLHCPLTPETEGLVDRERLQQMKAEAILLNTARGPLVVEEDLAAALQEGQIAAAALDVIGQEPMVEGNPLPGTPNLILSPHRAWRGPAALETLRAETVANVRAFLAGTPRNVVND